MEFLRKHSYDVNSLTVFMGFLLSSSSVFFLPSDPDIFLPPLNIEYLLWFMSILFALFAGVLAHYMLTNHNNYLLEICEYILYPIQIFVVVVIENQQTTNYLNFQQIACYTLVGLTCLGIIFKVIFINQMFERNNQLQILKVNTYVRIFRALKLFIICLLLTKIPIQIAEYITIFLNISEFYLVFSKFTYASLFIQYSLLVANFNNVLSPLFYFSGFNWSKQYGIGEFILAILYFTDNSCVKRMFEIKYMRKFDQIALQDKDFSPQRQIIMAQCFHNVVHLKNQMWSNKFYQFFRAFYLKLLHDHIQKLAHLKSCFQASKNGLSENIIKFYYLSEIDDTYMSSIDDIVNNQNVYYKFMQTYYTNYQSNDICEYYVSLTSSINSKFLLSNLINFCIKGLSYDLKLVQRIKIKKIKQYCKYFTTIYYTGSQEQNSLLKFQYGLQKIRSQLLQVFNIEIALVNTTINSTKDNIYDKEKPLLQRYESKKRMQALFGRAMADDSYYKNSEFCYMYLLYKLFICQLITPIQEEIYHRFMIPQHQTNGSGFNDEQSPIILCEGMKNGVNDMQSIIFMNSKFRKQFHQAQDEFPQLKIGHLMPKSQRDAHYKLIESVADGRNNFQKHQNYTCFVKYNLNSKDLDIFSKFNISVSIFNYSEGSMLYVCALKRICEDSYMQSQQYNDYQENYQLNYTVNGVNKKSSQSQSIFQLDICQSFIKIDDLCLQTLGFDRDYKQKSIDTLKISGQSEKLFIINKDHEQRHLQQIQKRLDEGNNMKTKNIKINIAIIFFTVLLTIATLVTAVVSQKKIEQIHQIIQTSQKYLSAVQGINYKLSLNMLKIFNSANSSLPSNYCTPFGINNLQQFGKQSYFSDNDQNIHIFLNEFYHEEYLQTMFQDVFATKKSTKIGSQLYTINYVSYLIKLISTFEQYLHYLKIQEKLTIAQINQIHNQVNKIIDTLSDPQCSQKLSAQINKKISEYLQLQNYALFYIKIAVVFMIGLISLLFLTVYVKTYKEIYRYIFIYTKNGKPKFLQRKEVLYKIRKEIKKIKQKSIEKITFSRDKSIEITNFVHNTINKRVTTLSEIVYQHENLAAINCQNLDSTSQFDLNKSQNTFITSFKKSAISKNLIFGILLIILYIVLYFMVDSLISLKIQTYELSQEIQQTRDAILTIETSNWIEHLNEMRNYRPVERNAQIYESALTILGDNDYIKKAISISENEKVIRILKKDLCDFLQDRTHCENDLQFITDQRLIQVLPAWIKDSQFQRQLVLIGNSQARYFLCKNNKILINYLEPSLVEIRKQIFNLFSEKRQAIKIFSLVIIGLTFLFTLYMSISLLILIFSVLPKIRKEVFAFDSAHNLYQIEQYRPYLNRVLNPQQ